MYVVFHNSNIIVIIIIIIVVVVIVDNLFQRHASYLQDSSTCTALVKYTHSDIEVHLLPQIESERHQVIS